MKKILLPFFIVFAGFISMVGLIMTRKKPVQTPPSFPGPLVEYMEVHPEERTADILSTGTVEIPHPAALVAEVGGTILQVASSFKIGGTFAPNEVLVKLDPTDYELQLKKVQAEVAQAEVALAMAKAEAEVAKKAWEMEHPHEPIPSTLVSKEIQVKEAEARLRAAQSQVAQAQRNLEKTQISFPFQGCFTEILVSPGQWVGPGQVLARAYSLKPLEVVVSLMDAQVSWFSSGAPVTMQAQWGTRWYTWRGRVARIEGTVDPITRMVKVRVRVGDVFARENPSVRLLPGMFVKVHIQGKNLGTVFPIPRQALHEHSTVWLAREGKVHIQRVSVVYTFQEEAWVGKGLQEGDKVITTPLEVVSEGMKIRVRP